MWSGVGQETRLEETGGGTSTDAVANVLAATALPDSAMLQVSATKNHILCRRTMLHAIVLIDKYMDQYDFSIYVWISNTTA